MLCLLYQVKKLGRCPIAPWPMLSQSLLDDHVDNPLKSKRKEYILEGNLLEKV